MPQSADIGSKRLIDLAAADWVKWLTGCSDVVVREVLSEEFQWISRVSDAVIRAFSPECGEFAFISEIQLRYAGRMPRRMFGYSGLATEKLDLPVYPDERLSELEPLLAFSSTFVLNSDIVKRIMRSDAADPMQSPWYQEIVDEGARRERLEAILVGLDVRFGPVPPRVVERIRRVTDPEALQALFKLTYTAASLEEFERAIP